MDHSEAVRGRASTARCGPVITRCLPHLLRAAGPHTPQAGQGERWRARRVHLSSHGLRSRNLVAWRSPTWRRGQPVDRRRVPVSAARPPMHGDSDSRLQPVPSPTTCLAFNARLIRQLRFWCKTAELGAKRRHLPYRPEPCPFPSLVSPFFPVLLKRTCQHVLPPIFFCAVCPSSSCGCAIHPPAQLPLATHDTWAVRIPPPPLFDCWMPTHSCPACTCYNSARRSNWLRIITVCLWRPSSQAMHTVSQRQRC